jgi:hypothetical protein
VGVATGGDTGGDRGGDEGGDGDTAAGAVHGGSPRAVACLRRATDFGLTTDIARELSGLLATLARAQADAADARRARASDRQAVRAGMEDLRAGAAVDPFGADALGADVSANQAVWSAELARLEGADSVEHWTRAAAAWDRLARPHDAAYCRWRAAQCALREGRGTVAARLLKRAATDAREHVPLSGAIAKTAAKGQ